MPENSAPNELPLIFHLIINRGGKKFFLSGNLGQRLEIFCKICNITIRKKQNKCINIVLFVFSNNRL